MAGMARLHPSDLGTVLGVWGHPDDEAYLASGLMALAVREGRRVACLTATRGEAGFPDLEVLSEAERRSMAAERDTNDRYLAAYLSDRIGAEFAGRISGVQRFGLFVRLDETGADGLIPVRALGREFFHYDEGTQTLMGSDTGLTLGIGKKVMVRLTEAAPVTGGLILDLLSVEGATLQAPRRKSGKYQPRKPAQSAAKRRVVRKRK